MRSGHLHPVSGHEARSVPGHEARSVLKPHGNDVSREEC